MCANPSGILDGNQQQQAASSKPGAIADFVVGGGEENVELMARERGRVNADLVAEGDE